MAGSLAEALVGKDPAYIQVALERVIHKILEGLSQPEAFFKPETEHSANGVGAVSDG